MMNLRIVDIVVISAIAVIAVVSIITIIMMNIDTGTIPIKRENVTLVSVSIPSLYDPFGSPLRNVVVNEQVLFQVEIKNLQNTTQPFVYIVHVTDKEGITASISYTASELPVNGTMKVAQSWIPLQAGIYDVEVFVWDSITAQKVLSPSRKITIEVKE